MGKYTRRQHGVDVAVGLGIVHGQAHLHHVEDEDLGDVRGRELAIGGHVLMGDGAPAAEDALRQYSQNLLLHLLPGPSIVPLFECIL